MKWNNDFCPRWRKLFAWFPVSHKGETVWLQSYWKRYRAYSDEERCVSCGTQNYIGTWDVSFIEPKEQNQ